MSAFFFWDTVVERRRLTSGWAGKTPFATMLPRSLLSLRLCRAGAGDMAASVQRKVTWQQVGRVAKPGRYLFRFGWLTIAAADIKIWQQHPEAALTLVSAPSSGIAEEYHLGVFELPLPAAAPIKTVSA